MSARRSSPLVRLALALALGSAASACKTGGGTTTPPGGGSGGGPGDDQVTQPVGRRYPAPPPPTAPKAVSFPEVQSFRLPNDLTVYVIENHEVPIVTAQLVVRCGTMDDEFLAPFAARMLGEGTRSRSKAKLDEAIEFVGGSLVAFADTHVSTVLAQSLSNDLKLAMLLMADEVQNPIFPPAALDKIKQEAKAVLRNRRAQPDQLADTLLRSVIYPPEHPYGRPLPTEPPPSAAQSGGGSWLRPSLSGSAVNQTRLANSFMARAPHGFATVMMGAPYKPCSSTFHPALRSSACRPEASAVKFAMVPPVVNPKLISRGKANRSTSQVRITSSAAAAAGDNT